MADYREETLTAYQSMDRAKQYKQYHTQRWTWGGYVTRQEQKYVRHLLSFYNWSQTDTLLDIPCGTGILGSSLYEFPTQIVGADISFEMMSFAEGEYPSDRLIKLIQTDVTKTPFRKEQFECVVVLGFLHRVPLAIKRLTLKEVYKLTNRVALVSCSVVKPLLLFKEKVLQKISSNYATAPYAIDLDKLVSECESQGFRVKAICNVVPVLSSHTLLLLEK